NRERGIDPQPLRKKIADITDLLQREDADTKDLLSKASGRGGKGRQPVPALAEHRTARAKGSVPATELADLVTELTDQMHAAARDLQFEVAARIRDEVSDLKRELRQMLEATR
ncbi:MAG TPA: UvrB/UvrC motif-containing protein, partial [Propionibacteriaceae bacterium]|nr:UvrB/UvrC motif-containing protein [Propionibacteriaceae bacterium]